MTIKDINIHVKTPGANQAKQQLDSVGQSAKQVGNKTGRAAKKGAAGINKLSQSTNRAHGRFSKFFSSIKSWAVGLVGITATIGAITKAIRVQIQAMKEHAQIAAEQQKKLIALQSMGTFFEDHPDARKEIRAYSEFGRRSFEEVTDAWYGLESKGAGLSEQQKKGIMHEALEFGRMEPEADLQSIVEMFSLYAKETREKDINLIQNVLRQTLSKAGASLSEVAQFMPRFLSLGISGGLTGAETAGIWAYATTRTGRPEEATTGLRNVFSALQGKGTPESQKLLSQLGITPEMGFFEQLNTIAAEQRAGRFGVPEAEMLAGRESIAVLLSMLTDPQAMMQTVGEVAGAARGDIDLVKEKLHEIMTKDEFAFLEDRRRQLQVKLKNIKGQNKKALKQDVFLKEFEVALREEGLSEWIVRFAVWSEEVGMAAGYEPGQVSQLGPLSHPKDYIPPHFYENDVPENDPSQPGGSTSIIVNDQSTNYYPRVGSDPNRGPRIEGGVMP